jgi:hypothetical protein
MARRSFSTRWIVFGTQQLNAGYSPKYPVKEFLEIQGIERARYLAISSRIHPQFIATCSNRMVVVGGGKEEGKIVN